MNYLENFNTKQELFSYLHENNKEIVEMKKASKKTHAFTPSLLVDSYRKSSNKELYTSGKEDTDVVIKRTIIGNTYNWLDSHGDVHVGNTFKKSISERSDKIFHLHDHEYKLTAKVGTPTKIYEKKVDWRDLGVNKDGQTIALMMDSNIEKLKNANIFQEYKDGNIDQHSVGMYYVNVMLAMNSDDPQHKEYKKTYNKYINLIGNKQKAEEVGYFYAVLEAKLIEISAVLQGSNELTPTVDVKNIEPTEVTQNNQSDSSTDKTTKESKVGSFIYY